ncbi:Restriction endonuclease [Mycobacteroides abscessus subsp. abscessus]|nr:Restriction endonuclease [Mycobacteroides abscessus subsp. abscessus]
MFIPTEKAFMDITPEEFEKYSLDLLTEQTQNLENLVIKHNVILETYDGNYQIDGYIEFTVMGIKYKTIVECKHYKSAITREKVQVLYGKIQSIGAQKGILISTSNFQSGAMEYARAHGIALIQITEAGTNFETRDQMNMIMNSGRKPFNYGKPYSGVLIRESDAGGISCSYLSRYNYTLGEFLEK